MMGMEYRRRRWAMQRRKQRAFTILRRPVRGVGRPTFSMPAVAITLMAALAATPLHAQTPDPPRAFLLFIDDLHLDFRQTPRTRALVQRMLRDVARDGDIWAVATTGTSSLYVAPTRDQTALKTAVTRVTGNGLKPEERLLVARGSS